MKTPITPDVAILKGIGKINGDGWKDVTREGEVVFVWNRELPAPYSPGQFPRVGLENWSASTDQYDFSPADADDVDAIRAALSTPTAPEAAPAITVENDCTFAEMVEQAQEDGKLVKAGLTSTPPARVAIERASTKLGYQAMGSGGRCDWDQLREAVAESTCGQRDNAKPFDPKFYPGHQMVEGINYNSLDRIVTAFVDAALSSTTWQGIEGDGQ